MKPSTLFARVAPLALGALLVTPAAGRAELGETPPPAVAAKRAASQLDFSDLEAVTDELFRPKMQEHRVSGGVIAVVYRGEPLLTKGYGLADVESGTAVDAERTLFRLGSISKTVTAVAVLQLVEEGRLSLDGDLRNQLDLRLPTRFQAPITLRQLLTHTSGFEVTDIGDAARRADDVLPLREVVAHHMTAQSWPPGTVHAYSNHGLTLAGYAVEHAAGVPFAEAVAARVFTPLGMARSSFAQPLPAHLAADLARGHEAVVGGFRPLPLDYSNVVPADTLQSTAQDMSRLMRALLAGGALGERRILSAASVREMTTPQFSYVDSQPITGLGLFFERHRGRWALAHTGGQLGFTSHMVLFPEEELGFFLALNTRTGRLRWEVLNGLLDRYLPEVPAAPPPQATGPLPRAELERYTGTYRRMDYPRHTIEKVMAAMGYVPEATVEATAEGNLRIGDTELLPLGDGRFWAEPWQSELRFEAEPGQPAQRVYDRNAWERIGFWSRGAPHLVLWAVAAVLFLSYLVTAGARAWRNRNRPPEPTARRWPARLVTAVAAVYTAALVAFLVLSQGAAGQMDYGLPTGVRLVLLAFDLGALLTVAAVPASLAALRHPGGNPWSKAHLAIVTLAAIALTASLVTWNLVG